MSSHLEQIRLLAAKAHKEKRQVREAKAIEQANYLWPALCKEAEFMFGLALYIGEGDKGPSRLALVNSDPRVLRKGKEFFHILGVTTMEMRLVVQLHQGNDVDAARSFWAEQLPLPLENISINQVKGASSGKNSIPMGTGSLRVYNRHYKRMVDRWMELAL